MESLKDWILKASDSNNKIFLENLQSIYFDSVVQETSSEDLSPIFNKWDLSGSTLISKYFQIADDENEDEISIISSKEIRNFREEFLGWIDQSGNGVGQLIRRNLMNGLADVILDGEFKEGLLEGKVRETVPDQTFCDTYYKGGQRHGFFRRLRQDKKFEEIGIYISGRRSLKSYLKRCDGNSFLIGSFPVKTPFPDVEKFPVSGTQNDGFLRECVYLYPDLKSAVIGKFLLKFGHKGKELSGHLVSGHFGKVKEVNYRNGLPNPKVIKTSEIEIKFDPSTEFRISSAPHLEEPYEQETVSVGPSQIPFAGEGLFSKRRILKDELICLFNGLRCNKDLMPRIVPATHEKWSDYRLNLDKSTDLDIPLNLVSIEHYRATLGHKACHSFRLKNAKFKEFFHPRFGNIMSVVAVSDIETGEEVFVNYNYAVSLAPVWYKEQWFQHLRDDLQWSEEKIEDWTSREIARWGYSM